MPLVTVMVDVDKVAGHPVSLSADIFTLYVPDVLNGFVVKVNAVLSVL